MIKLIKKNSRANTISATLTLPLTSRIKSRLRVTLDSGQDAGLFLERGTTLKDGDRLCTEDGYNVQVIAANEPLSQVVSDNPHLLARACYHLGNRHVSIQIEPTCISFQHDHVLDEMLRGLGMKVTLTKAPFEPEPGAYGGSAEKGRNHTHTQAHGHDHDQHH